MAENDILLVLDGIKGESQDRVYPNAVEVTGFSWGGSATGTDSPTSGRVRLLDVSFSKRVDVASTGLFMAMTTRKSIKTATFHFRRASGDGSKAQVPYLQVELSDAYVVAVNYRVSEEGEGHTDEDVVINFSKVEMTYTQQAETGGKTLQTTAGYAIPK